MRPSFGTNQAAEKINVYYEGGSTIYEGMPVCYNFDTTTSVVGTIASGTKTMTIAEGSQCDGKYKRVENPADDNLLWFAGTVAGSTWNGLTGPRWLDINVGNGAIVPVRADVYCIKGRTILALEAGSQALTQPLSTTQGRPVAIAEETVDLSTPGIVLARLCPAEFIYQDNTGDALIAVGSEGGISNIVVNRMRLTSAQTSGSFCALELRSTVSAGGYANSTSGGGLCAYFRGEVSGTPASSVCAVHVQLLLSAGTPADYISALHVKLAESGCTMTSAQRTHPLRLETLLTHDVTAAAYSWIFLENNGTYPPNYLLDTASLTDIPMATTSDETVTHKIPIRVGSTTYYICCATAA